MKTMLNFSTSNVKQLNKRDMKMTWTILVVCLCYIGFVAPLTVVLTVGIKTKSVWFDVCICLYWCQYSVNFFVYFWKSKQYRDAYILFLNVAWSKIKSCFNWGTVVNHTTILIVHQDLLPPNVKGYYKEFGTVKPMVKIEQNDRHQSNAISVSTAQRNERICEGNAVTQSNTSEQDYYYSSMYGLQRRQVCGH